MNKISFRYSILYVALLGLSISRPAYTEEEVFSLPSIDLTVRQQQKTENELTGLGKVYKSAEDISKAQILDIRDLTRYDPGISVVEQGRGASSGYAIRGVDKNRVGVFVDGIPQAQSYQMQSNVQGYMRSGANGGAINEVEFENMQAVELSKGASSSQYGSGALGGAVNFRTKEADDIIQQGEQWGLQSKSAYSSRNNHLLNSIAAAGRLGKLEALAIYTHRNGKETESHDAVDNLQMSYQPLTGYVNGWDVHTGTRFNNYYLIQDDCPGLNCAGVTPLATANLNWKNPIRLTPAEVDALSPEARKQYEQMNYQTVTTSAKDYTGPSSIKPDPMDYKSDSLLLKTAYQFNEAHRLVALAELSKQHYDLRDLTLPAYYEAKDVTTHGDPAKGYWDPKLGILSGLTNGFARGAYSYAYTRAKFYEETHKKRRFGLSYDYTPEDNPWVDSMNLTINHQKIHLDSLMYKSMCSIYPNVDASCRPNSATPWANYEQENNTYEERHNLIQLRLDKALTTENTSHNLQFLLGFDKFESTLDRDMHRIYSDGGLDLESYTGSGRFDDPRIFRRKPITVTYDDLCLPGVNNDLGCNKRKIKGHNIYLSLQNHMSLGQYVDLGVGLRYDHHRFKSDDSYTTTGRFNNFSWNTGLVIKPSEHFNLLYRISSGFRVPAFYELHGIRGPFQQRNDDLKSEKALNQEVGFALNYDALSLEASYFHNRYEDLIARGNLITSSPNHYDGYYNIQDVTLHGVSVGARLNVGSLFAHLRDAHWIKNASDGLYMSFAYNKVKVKKADTDSNYTNTLNAPILDAIQPARYVFGVGYDAPNERWGVNWFFTYSEAKKRDEVASTRRVGSLSQPIPSRLTRSWYTHDLTGYAKIGRHATIRAGVYNLFNYKYSTWESVRQTTPNAVNQDRNLTGARYAAPGRNFNLALELKF